MTVQERASGGDDNHVTELSAIPSAPEASASRISIRRVFFVVAYNILAVLLILSGLELAILGSLRFSGITAHLPKSIRYYPIWTYTHLDRLMAYDFYSYDKDLAYTLEPNIKVNYTNREYSVLLESNSLGFRDDETSLERPEVVALGDSFCMGWGVEADESFAQLVERDSGLKVLNTGLPSYGTAREVILCNSKVDTGGLKYLIVQYCENDLHENSVYIDNGRTYSGGRIESFNRRTSVDRRRREYYFGKYLISNLSLLSDRMFSDGNRFPELSL